MQLHIYQKGTYSPSNSCDFSKKVSAFVPSHKKHCRHTILLYRRATPLAGAVTQSLGVAAVMAVSYGARYDPIQFSRPSEPSLPTVQLPPPRQTRQDDRTGCRPFAVPSRHTRQRHSSVTCTIAAKEERGKGAVNLKSRP